jgi:hypothetical protein
VTAGRVHDEDQQVMTAAEVRQWSMAVAPEVVRLLALPHAPAAPSEVALVGHEAVAEGPYGGWMLTWPEPDPANDRQVIHHLPDGRCFVALLHRTYDPVLRSSPHLGAILDDRSRLEMAVTNDTLQVQLVPGEPPYSMIRHHALMLYEAALWLPSTQRDAWLTLYDEMASVALHERGAVPSTAELADVEAAGFAAMRELAPLTFHPEDRAALFEQPLVEPIVRFQVWAAAAVGVLRRDHEASGVAGDPDAWHDRQLGRYQEPDYLDDVLHRYSTA